MAAELNFEDLSRDIMIVDDLVLADTKVVAAFTINHLARLIGYRVCPFLLGRESVAAATQTRRIQNRRENSVGTKEWLSPKVIQAFPPML